MAWFHSNILTTNRPQAGLSGVSNVSISQHRASQAFKDVLGDQFHRDEFRACLAPKFHEAPPRVRNSHHVDAVNIQRRWGLLNVPDGTQAALLDAETQAQCEAYQHNIENFIGTVKVPLGLVGPLRVNGLYAQGDYYLPLATTEAALVASYNRGAHLITHLGGCSALLMIEGISRVPSFAFENLEEVGTFVLWVLNQKDHFKALAESTTRHGKLVDMSLSVDGNHVYTKFEYTTGNAAGQNMVTIATQAVYDYIVTHSPVTPRYSFIETNMSGDKKANAHSFMGVRGKKVAVELSIPGEALQKYLHTTPQKMFEHWQMCAMGSMLIGSLGLQGHYANGLAAFYMATGQDVACVAESAVGLTRFELMGNDTLYTSVTLPNLTVGTVGGGTGLPSQKACMDIVGIQGEQSALAFAEICGALALAGELSIIGALSCGEFTRAHRKLARDKGQPQGPSHD
jgi:hydroxymethylglutaryl-CoA reductase (NADPH)